MLDKLYLDNLLIGEIQYLDHDFPTFNGQFNLILKPTDPDSKQIIDYIDFSCRQTSFYMNENEDDEEDLEEKLLAEELKYENLINSENWKIIESDGQLTKILIPTFDKENGINWRLNTN